LVTVDNSQKQLLLRNRHIQSCTWHHIRKAIDVPVFVSVKLSVKQQSTNNNRDVIEKLLLQHFIVAVGLVLFHHRRRLPTEEAFRCSVLAVASTSSTLGAA
jgi:hypothetical protein